MGPLPASAASLVKAAGPRPPPAPLLQFGQASMAPSRSLPGLPHAAGRGPRPVLIGAWAVGAPPRLGRLAGQMGRSEETPRALAATWADLNGASPRPPWAASCEGRALHPVMIGVQGRPPRPRRDLGRTHWRLPAPALGGLVRWEGPASRSDWCLGPWGPSPPRPPRWSKGPVQVRPTRPRRDLGRP